MAQHNIIGREGEQAAIRYLKQKEYEILAVNWKHRKLELDIVAKYQHQLIVVEVKTRDANGLISPEEAVTKKKQKNIVKAADAYAKEYDINNEVRFDILSITKAGKEWKVEHIEDAFYPLL